MRLATIDIGTNTTLLLVAERQVDGSVRALEERAEITRLGRGIGIGGRLQPENVERTLDVLRGYAALAAEHQAPIAAIGTEALRRAPNGDDFLEPAARILGTAVEVISGDREAALTFLAASRSFPEATANRCMVIDIGGGSTEVILAQQGHILFQQSLPLGSVRLTEAYVRHDPATADELTALRAAVDAQLAVVQVNPSEAAPTLVGCAGTVTTLAAMAQGLGSYDPARVHGYKLTRAALEAQVSRLATAAQPEREAMAGLDPRRADVILAGACLLLEIVKHMRAPEVLVSDRGIRWGLLFEQLERAPAERSDASSVAPPYPEG